MSRRIEEAGISGYLSARMQEKLALHSNRDHWEMEGIEYLFARLMQEVKELRDAVRDGETAEEVWYEAADVANLAAMVAHNYGGMP